MIRICKMLIYVKLAEYDAHVIFGIRPQTIKKMRKNLKKWLSYTSTWDFFVRLDKMLRLRRRLMRFIFGDWQGKLKAIDELWYRSEPIKIIRPANYLLWRLLTRKSKWRKLRRIRFTIRRGQLELIPLILSEILIILIAIYWAYKACSLIWWLCSDVVDVGDQSSQSDQDESDDNY